MEYDNLFEGEPFCQAILPENSSTLLTAIMKVYPMIVLSNLTKNRYVMLRDEGFLYNDIVSSGVYDDLIDNNVENIHENYQEIFLKCFSRDNLLREYANGKTDVYAELYQKDRKGSYQWVSTHVIKVQNESDDIIQICFNRPLGGIVEEHHQHF